MNASNGTAAKENTEVADSKIVLYKSEENGQYVYLGYLQFDESNRATLITEDSTPEVEQLKQDWAEVSGRSELMWKKSVPGEVDGRSVMRIIGEDVKPGDDDYIYAVFNTMERSYGYRAQLAD